MRDASGFWRNLCAMNRASAGRAGTDAKVMLYTIGISFTAELLVKSAYENTFGRFFEWAGGYDSADDHYSARIQQTLRRLHARDALVRIPLRQGAVRPLADAGALLLHARIGRGASP